MSAGCCLQLKHDARQTSDFLIDTSAVGNVVVKRYSIGSNYPQDCMNTGFYEVAIHAVRVVTLQIALEVTEL